MMRRSGTAHAISRHVLLATFSGALVVGLLSIALVGAVSAPGTAQTATPPDGVYAVIQDDRCTEVTPMGDGSRTVSEYYGYSPNFSYSSAGTRRIQQNQVSSLFVYDGARGDSLVFVHDEYDGPSGGAISMTLTGLPESGTWAVEDDEYEGRDDSFNHSGSRSEIDWVWRDDRTDGAAFRGLTGIDETGLTIAPSFDEDATLWGTWANRSYGGRVDSWRLLSGDGASVATLDMDTPVTIRQGGCDRTPPKAALSIQSSQLSVGQPVTLSATDATDETGIVAYQWDVDGDGVVERNTTSATVTTQYSAVGEYQPTVTVRDDAGNTDSTTLSVTVSAESHPRTIQRGSAGGVRTALVNTPGSRCGFWFRQPLGQCVGTERTG